MQKFLELVSEALEKDLDSVNAGDVFRNYDEWDSLAHLTIISLIDEEYGMVIPRDEFRSMQSWADVYKYISETAE